MPRMTAQQPTISTEKPKAAPLTDTETKQQLEALRLECREFVEFIKQVPSRMLKERFNIALLQSDINSRADKFSKVIGK